MESLSEIGVLLAPPILITRFINKNIAIAYDAIAVLFYGLD